LFLKGNYAGDCKNGYAHGKGDAKGSQHYVGQFKYGLPNGQGTYYYSDSVYHTGAFQDGIKEGKGTSYYVRPGKADSVVKGYWSADIFRGKTYKTYSVSNMPVFDRYEITPSDETGNTLIIEVATTSGSVIGSPNSTVTPSIAMPVLTVTDVIALDGSFIRKMELPNSIKYSVTYEIKKFPVRLQVLLSNAQSFNLELYKAAKWKVLLFLNK
jgi:hypothetical protein